ncbi:MAG: phosphotransferase [Anaerolineales bacterium]|nr:phosphotransferase [Anaerolineales bacterium]
MSRISIDHPLARGRTADVHEWEAGYILKLFHNWFSLEDIEYEQKIARAVHASGVKTPAVGDLVQVEGRNGLVYERVEGVSMLEMFQQKPWRVIQLGRLLAKLHAQMHECVFDADVPHQRKKLEFKIRNAHALPTPLKTALTTLLLSLPDGDRVCHGDFHPANVLITKNDSTIIDWIDASRGNPLADVARTSIITLGAVASSQIPQPVLKVFVRVFHSAYLKHYFRLRPGGKEEYRRWLPVVAGARLNENIPELEKWLVGMAKKVGKS